MGCVNSKKIAAFVLHIRKEKGRNPTVKELQEFLNGGSGGR